MKAEAVATPLEPVVAVAVIKPLANVPLAPLAGAVKVTISFATGLPEPSCTLAESAVPKAVLMAADCPDPAFAASVTVLPVPWSVMAWEPGALLSVNVSDPLSRPAATGAKLIDRMQESPAASVAAACELEETRGHAFETVLLSVKPAAMLGLWPVEGIGKVRSPLPVFSSVTVFGLSLLARPTSVAAKFSVGGVAALTSRMRLLPSSVMYRFPAASSVISWALLNLALVAAPPSPLKSPLVLQVPATVLRVLDALTAPFCAFTLRIQL